MFEFDCKCCGDCCSGDMDIFVNIYDLYKIGRHLNFNNSSELFEKGLFEIVKGQNGALIPKIKFKTSPYKFCPFLINDIDENNNLKGFCSLHPFIKPLVCILAPVSRSYSVDKSSSDYTFTNPTENCPGLNTGRVTSVKKTIKPVIKEIKYEEIFFNCLDSIVHNKRSNYQIDLYQFDLERDFDEILSEIESIFLAN